MGFLVFSTISSPDACNRQHEGNGNEYADVFVLRHDPDNQPDKYSCEIVGFKIWACHAEAAKIDFLNVAL